MLRGMVSAVGIGAVAGVLVCLAAASPSSMPTAKKLLPRTCPPVALVRSTLRVKVTKVTTYTTELEYPYGSVQLPVKRPPAYQKTCVYSADGKYAGQIVPATISFAAVVTKKDFASSRANAARSVKTFAVERLGDAAWAVGPPKFDPRPGSSLFVLTGSLDIVLTAPNQASVARLEALARRLV